MLLALILLPLLGVLFLVLVPEKRNAYGVALWFSLAHVVLSAVLWWKFDTNVIDYQYVAHYGWLDDISMQVGVDSLSVLFVCLTSFLIFLCVLSSNMLLEPPYWALLLCVESFLVGTFCTVNLIAFYIFFEAALIPLFFLIYLWGGENRRAACMRFFLYTFTGSIFMLVGLMILIQQTGCSHFHEVYAVAKSIPAPMQQLVGFLFLLGLAIKIPMLPLHTWLPYAHVEAPMAGSVLLAGIMLKMGGYGMLRLMLPITPVVCSTISPWMMWASVAAILYASVLAYAQKDMKRLVAYASVAHMGYVTLGMFTLSPLGVVGCIFQMISHGLASAGLFFVVGFLYERTHSRQIQDYRGLVQAMPVLSLAMMFFTLSSIGLPGTMGFWGECTTLIAAFAHNRWVAICAALGMVVGAVYMLYLYRVCFWGRVPSDAKVCLTPLNLREKCVLILLSLCVITYGVCPDLITRTIQHADRRTLFVG